MPASAVTTTQTPSSARSPSADARPTASLDEIQLVAVAVDGTLVDLRATKRDTFQATLQMLADRGLDVDPDRQAPALFSFAREVGLDDPDVVPRFLAEQLGVEDERWTSYGRRVMQRLEPGMVQLYPDVIATLDRLRSRGYRLYAVTDAPREAVHRRLPPNGLSGRFDRIVVREDTPRGKADPRPFEQLVEGADAAPRELLVVGDHPTRDVGNAIELGAHGVLATHGNAARPEALEAGAEPAATIDGLAELLDHLPGADEDETPVPIAPW